MSKNLDALKSTYQGVLKSNVSEISPGTVYSPSLYDELFDEKTFNQLISDPFLTSTSGQNRENNDIDSEVSAATKSIEENIKDNTRMEPHNYGMNGFNYDNQIYDQTLPDTSTTEAVAVIQNQHQKLTYNQAPAAWHPQMASAANFDPGIHTYATNGNATAPIYVNVKTEPKDESESDVQEYRFSRDSMSPVSRGAAYAREYRRKNKKRVSQLEIDHERLLKENRVLKEAYDAVCAKASGLDREVTYLRQVLANDSSIAKLVDSVAVNASGLKFQWPLTANGTNYGTNSSSLSKDDRNQGNLKRKVINDPNLASKLRKVGADTGVMTENGNNGPGVCFHVSGDMISLEFCSKCNRDAKRGAGDLP